MKTNEKLKELRELNHWSQEDLAKKMHIAPSSYAKIERGETRLTLERLEQFAEIFDIEIGQLIQPDNSSLYQVNENNSSCYIYNHNVNVSKNNEKEYQSEIEKLQLIIQHKEEINIKLQEQIQDLRLLVSTLTEKNNSN
ncbi:MAG: helix-turn-helix transcriptional regulator [Moraxellaceae bacterium]|nr:helix-turn-helix transcriptional regulator [Moraxellaceae bacterium]